MLDAFMSLDEVRCGALDRPRYLPTLVFGKHIGFGGDPVTRDSSSVALQLKMDLQNDSCVERCIGDACDVFLDAC
jgi:hypothetical protein